MILTKILQSNEVKEIPLLNYAEYASKSSLFFEYKQTSRKKRLMRLVQNSPEALSLVRMVVADIWSGFHFEPINSSESGRNKIKKAETFSKSQRFKRQAKNALTDTLITGEGFNWMGLLTEQQVNNIVSLFPEDTDEEIITRARKIRYVASTSMVTKHTDTHVTNYKQSVGTRGDSEKEFQLGEMIKITFDEMDGKIEGFTPFMSLPLHLELLWLLWQNQYSSQKKGNQPNLIVSANNVNENSLAYKKIEKELKAYNRPGSPNHGTLFFSAGRDGKVDFKELSREDSLQFKEVDQYITSLVAMQWQIPQSRIAIKTDQSAKAKDSNSSADRAYWYNIKNIQEEVSDIYNSQLWEPHFGVRMVFNKSYLQDEVAEGNAKALKLANLNTTLEILKNKGKTLSETSILNFINGRYEEISDNDITELTDDEREAMISIPKTGHLAEPKEDSTQQLAAEKRKEEVEREKGAGVPSGV